jgi:hypothetical protein
VQRMKQKKSNGRILLSLPYGYRGIGNCKASAESVIDKTSSSVIHPTISQPINRDESRSDDRATLTKHDDEEARKQP